MLAFKRGKRKYIADHKINEIYNTYLKRTANPVSKKIFKDILQDLNCDKVFRIVAEGDEIYLPYRLGSIRLRKKKMKIKVTDGKIDRTRIPVKWAETKKMWEQKYPTLTADEIAVIPIEEKGLVYEWNQHSNGDKFRFFWDKLTCNIKNKSFYTFKATRNARQLVTKMLKEDSNTQYKYFK